MLTLWGGKQRFCDRIDRRDFLGYHGGPPDQGGRPGLQQRRLPEVPHRQRPHDAQTCPRPENKGDELEGQAKASRADDGRHHRRDGQQPEGQRCRHDLGESQQRG